jgi:hypothetical protein
MDLIEVNAFNNSILAYVFVAAVTFSQSRGDTHIDTQTDGRGL